MIKNKLIKKILLYRPSFYQAACFLTRKINPRVLVYHRFCYESDKSQYKIDRNTFEWQLKKIIKQFKVVNLKDYLNMINNKQRIPLNLATITVDDGYHDFYEIAYPILKKYGLCATLFPVVNFVEKKIWLWPDRIQCAIENTDKEKINFSFNDQIFTLNFSSKEARWKSFNHLITYSISIANNIKRDFIEELENMLEVNLPELPPREFSSVTWNQLKEMNENGIEVGNHTLNHPILSRIPPKELRDEVFLSKKIIEKKIDNEVVSFCYPNSFPEDINERVVKEVKLAGYKGAVFYILPGFNDIFRIPRIPVVNDKVNFLWHLSGLEYLTNHVKSLFVE